MSEDVRSRLRARHVAGADRYATAAAVARDTFSRAPVAYLATDSTSPKALAGVPVAARDRAPLLLAVDSCVTCATRGIIAAFARRRLAPC